MFGVVGVGVVVVGVVVVEVLVVVVGVVVEIPVWRESKMSTHMTTAGCNYSRIEQKPHSFNVTVLDHLILVHLFFFFTWFRNK